MLKYINLYISNSDSSLKSHHGHFFENIYFIVIVTDYYRLFSKTIIWVKYIWVSQQQKLQKSAVVIIGNFCF